MSPKFTALLIISILYIPFWAWYLYARRRINNGFRFRVLLFLNMVFGYFMIFLIPFFALIHFNLVNIIFIACLLLMIPGAIMHHTSVLLLKKKDNPPLLELIHGPVSHIAIGIPLVISGIVGLITFYPYALSAPDFAVCLFWFIETEFFGLLLTLMGFNLSKLVKK